VEAIRLSGELGGQSQAEADVVDAVAGLVAVAIRDAAVLRFVEVAAAANHAINALMMIDRQETKVHFSSIFLHLHSW